MKNKIKIGIWGLSEHTQKNIIPAILKNKKYSLDKIYSRSKNKNYSKISITNNLNIFLNKCNLDLIYVCLPVSLHYQAVLKCLNSNLNVICEKPLTNKYNDFKKLKALAKSKKLIILESLMYQYHPSLKEIKKLIKKNKYELLEIDFLIPKLKRNNFRNNKKLGASAFWDIGYYNLSIINILFNEYKILNIKSNILFKNKIDFFGTIEFSIKNLIVILTWGYGFNYRNSINISNEFCSISMQNIFSKKNEKASYLEIHEDSKKQIKYKAVNQFRYIFEHYLKLNKNYNHAKKEMSLIDKRIYLADSIYYKNI